VLEETRDLTGDGTRIGSMLGVVGKLVVTDFGIPRSAAIIYVFDGFPVGGSCGLSAEISEDLLDIPYDMNHWALLGVRFENISSGGSLDDTTT
jgi:hypothetical protein